MKTVTFSDEQADVARQALRDYISMMEYFASIPGVEASDCRNKAQSAKQALEALEKAE